MVADRQTSKMTVPADSSASVEQAPKAATVASESVTEEVTPGAESETPAEAVAPEAPEIGAVEVPMTTTPAKAPRAAKSAASGATTAKKAGNPRAKAGANSAG